MARHNLSLGLALAALAGACAPAPAPGPAGPPPPDAARPATPPIPSPSPPPGALGRAGPVTLDERGLREAVEEARVLQAWRSGRPPPLAALDDPGLRRRLLTQALETRVVRLEVAARGLAVAPEAVARLLEQAADGRPPDLEARGPAPDLDGAGQRAARRLDTRPEVVARVARDLLEARALAEDLLDGTPEAALRQAWLDAGTRARLRVIQVPRVPSAAELDRFVRARGEEIDLWYEAHRGRFEQPARARVHRVMVPAPEEDETARARAEALRARAEAGEPLPALAAEAGDPAPGGWRGRVADSTLPAAFEGPAGGLTPVLRLAEGFGFFRVESRTPAVIRRVDDERVRREIAAAILEERDELPEAMALARRARGLLQAAPEGEGLAALVREARLRMHDTEPFARGDERVPGLGLAPEVARAAFTLSPEAPVTGPHRVRQHYVVARLTSREDASPEAWATAREAWTARWRAARLPRAVDEWLSERLAGEPLWVDSPALEALRLVEAPPP